MLFVSVVALVLGSVLSYFQITRGRTVASFAVGGQLVCIVGLLLLGETYYRPLAMFIIGTLVGAAAAAASHRGRLRTR
jgi:hypothetical protein